MRSKVLIVAAIVFAVFFIFKPTYAHPGNTASDGCHYCRTNCDSWGEVWNARHCHGGTSTPAPTYTPPVYKPVITTKNETKTEIIPFETKYETDENLEEGTEVVKQEGKEGIRTITYSVTYTDGKETNRAKSNEAVTTEPVAKVIAKGTKKKEALPANNEPEANNDAEVAGASDSDGSSGLVTLAVLGGGYYLFKRMRKKVDEKK